MSEPVLKGLCLRAGTIVGEDTEDKQTYEIRGASRLVIMVPSDDLRDFPHNLIYQKVEVRLAKD